MKHNQDIIRTSVINLLSEKGWKVKEDKAVMNVSGISWITTHTPIMACFDNGGNYLGLMDGFSIVAEERIDPEDIEHTVEQFQLKVDDYIINRRKMMAIG